MSEVAGRAGPVARPPDRGCRGREGRPGPTPSGTAPLLRPTLQPGSSGSWVKWSTARLLGRLPGLPGCDTGGSRRLPGGHRGASSDCAHSAFPALSPRLRPPDAAGSWSWARLRLQPLSGSCLQVSGLQGAVSPTSPSCPRGFAKSSKLRGSEGQGFCGMGPWSPGWWPVTRAHPGL